jgi:hypothetical protein
VQPVYRDDESVRRVLRMSAAMPEHDDAVGAVGCGWTHGVTGWASRARDWRVASNEE